MDDFFGVNHLAKNSIGTLGRVWSQPYVLLIALINYYLGNDKYHKILAFFCRLKSRECLTIAEDILRKRPVDNPH
jgi:hypothetical protein